MHTTFVNLCFTHCVLLIDFILCNISGSKPNSKKKNKYFKDDYDGTFPPLEVCRNPLDINLCPNFLLPKLATAPSQISDKISLTFSWVTESNHLRKGVAISITVLSIAINTAHI